MDLELEGTAYRLGEQEVVILWLHPQVLEYRVGPEAFHKILAIINILCSPPSRWRIPSCLFDRA